MQAKFKGRCGICGKAVNIGDEITWSRQPKTALPYGGKVYHKVCAPKLAELTPAPTGAPAPLVPHGVDAVALAELIRKVMGTPAPVAVADEEEPGEADFAPAVPDTATVAVAKRTAKSAPSAKLNSRSEWYEVLRAVLLAGVRRILLIGPPSSGKSTTAQLEAGTKYRVTMTETTSNESLIGQFQLIDGSTVCVNGPFANAMVEGKGVLVDEIDKYSPEASSMLYSLIDDKPHIGMPDGKYIEAVDGYMVLMTTNENIDTLPPAVQDRIEVIILASTPHPAALDAPGLTPAMRKVCQRYYEAQPTPTIKLPPTVRRMRTLGKLIENGIPNDIAARLVFGEAGAREVLSALTSAEGDSTR